MGIALKAIFVKETIVESRLFPVVHRFRMTHSVVLSAVS